MTQRLLDQTSEDAVAMRGRLLLAAMPSIESVVPARPNWVPAMRRRRVVHTSMSLAFAALMLAAGVAAAAANARSSSPLHLGEARQHEVLGAATARLVAAMQRVEMPLPPAPAASTSVADDVATATASRGAVTARASTSRPELTESELVLRAVRALRRDGDPVLAGSLAEECLRRFPSGQQTEEALVVAMQSADARGNKAAAERHAHRYLAQYPGGRFAVQARSLSTR